MEYRDTHTIDDDTKNNMTFLANILTALLWSSKTKKNEWNTLKALYFLCSQFCILATLYIENLYIFYWLVMQQTSSNKSDKKVNTNKKQNMKSLAEQYYAL